MSTTPETNSGGPRLRITPPQIVGPFYPLAEPPNCAGDLARATGGKAQPRGQLLYVTGRVLTCGGVAVAGATIEIWQANSDGKYCHPSDLNPAPLDPNFRGFARITTDAEGRYRLRTIKPGGYPTAEGDIRPPHIHFSVDGQCDRLVTQLYFAGEPENQTDRWLNAAPDPEQLITTLDPPNDDVEPWARMAAFDLILRNG